MKNESTPVELARKSLTYYLEKNKLMPTPDNLSEELKRQAGVFVSFKSNGELRGCIGTFQPTQPSVAEEIINNAVAAGTQDPRFWPIEVEEIPKLNISVDLLESPEHINSISELDPQKYGVIVRCGRRSGLLLPMLEGVDTANEQVEIAMQKAGIRPGEEIELFRFTVTRYT
ncbi:AmmeMemoRadiSam system protein A [Dendrosporobacter sp. 1207_IL3150]|uniref:AmmeMemoRadiSam system protein A n=1 Tax=Dendrosporobacter sp. 1207_IL3150 TaxID=3084054 RepID=UPI002FDA806C